MNARNQQCFDPCRRNRRRHVPDQHLRPCERRPGRLHVQPVPDSRCRATAVPHRSADVVRGGARGHRPRAPGGHAPVHLVLARRGGRVWFAQSVARRRAAGRAPLRPDRGHGVHRGSGGPPAPRACRSGASRARRSMRCSGSTRRTCRTGGNAGSSPRPRRPPCSVATCSRSSATCTLRSPKTTSSSPAKWRGPQWTTTRTRRTPAACSNASRPRRPRRLACMHGPAWRGDGGALLRSLALRLA